MGVVIVYGSMLVFRLLGSLWYRINVALYHCWRRGGSSHTVRSARPPVSVGSWMQQRTNDGGAATPGAAYRFKTDLAGRAIDGGVFDVSGDESDDGYAAESGRRSGRASASSRVHPRAVART